MAKKKRIDESAVMMATEAGIAVKRSGDEIVAEIQATMETPAQAKKRLTKSKAKPKAKAAPKTQPEPEGDDAE